MLILITSLARCTSQISSLANSKSQRNPQNEEKKKRLDIGNSRPQQTHKAHQSNKHATPDEANSLPSMHHWKNSTKHDHFITPVSTTLEENEQ
ncbi:hypothetical protein EUGRSUZ_E00533 [Eucalyptus grandis]|uniref:Uncharacterized protein n=2 Tax=Eucalyptus grandis TaxID=71139 RepID=A0ACC3KSW8_EUCGR|nr:hypothetical protein EUGRSUZ_E00533 [Eucalyptus grandis]